MPDRVLNAPIGAETEGYLVGTNDILLNAIGASGEVTLIDTDLPNTFNAPGLALPAEQKQFLLSTLLPPGQDVYVGLFSSMPANDGTGGIEAVGSGYGRVAHSQWTNARTGQVVRRMNASAVLFAELTDDLSVRGWGIWSASTGGTLLAFGYTRNAGGNPVILNFAAADQPRFPPLELVVGIQ